MNYNTLATLHYTALDYTTRMLHLQLQLHYTNYITLQLEHHYTRLHLQLQLRYTTLHPAVVVEGTTATSPKPTFGPVVVRSAIHA